MITNDRQYKIAKSQLEDFRVALEGQAFATPENIHPLILDAHRAAIQSKLSELTNEITEYEDLKEGRVLVSEIASLDELPLILIKARIVNQLTQSELAEKLNMKMQQIQRYEAEKYQSASLKTLLKIANELNVSVNADIQLKENNAPEILDIKNYPFKQMFQRNWFGTFFGSYGEAARQSSSLLAEFFEKAGTNDFKYSLTKKTFRIKTDYNQFALNAWYARILIKARSQKLESIFDKELLDDAWIESLAQLSSKNDGPLKAVEFLQSSGIKFIVEPVIEGTLLDGAVLLDDNMSPVIAMTLRYDRLDNFWFVLFHEIAHIILHLNDNLNVIFDDLDSSLDGIEQEADQFALNALIADEVWRKSLVRFNPSKETIVNQARIINVHPALLAGRIRKETGKFHLFSDLVGQGEVRKYFQGQL